jgi:NAD(P)-dependent dehydrogenase (short-subunit alcohol dehydrogenase family)
MPFRPTAAFNLDSKVALGSGIGSGIGRAIAHTSARNGAVVWFVDRDLAAARATVEAIRYSEFKAGTAKT